MAGAVALGGCAPGPVAEGPVAPTLAEQWRAEGPQPGEKGCFARQTRPAVVETETEQVLVAAEKRDPATGEGRIIGLALRDFPRVTGDGRSTVAQLIKASCRAGPNSSSGSPIAADSPSTNTRIVPGGFQSEPPAP